MSPRSQTDQLRRSFAVQWYSYREKNCRYRYLAAMRSLLVSAAFRRRCTWVKLADFAMQLTKGWLVAKMCDGTILPSRFLIGRWVARFSDQDS